MTWFLAVMAVFALGFAWLVCAVIAEHRKRQRLVEIRRELTQDQFTRERLDRIARMQQRGYRGDQ